MFHAVECSIIFTATDQLVLTFCTQIEPSNSIYLTFVESVFRGASGADTVVDLW